MLSTILAQGRRIPRRVWVDARDTRHRLPEITARAGTGRTRGPARSVGVARARGGDRLDGQRGRQEKRRAAAGDRWKGGVHGGARGGAAGGRHRCSRALAQGSSDLASGWARPPCRRGARGSSGCPGNAGLRLARPARGGRPRRYLVPSPEGAAAECAAGLPAARCSRERGDSARQARGRTVRCVALGRGRTEAARPAPAGDVLPGSSALAAGTRSGGAGPGGPKRRRACPGPPGRDRRRGGAVGDGV